MYEEKYLIIDNDQRNVFMNMSHDQVKEYVNDVLQDFGPEGTKEVLIILNEEDNIVDNFINEEVN